MRATFKMINNIKISRALNRDGIDIYIEEDEEVVIHIEEKDISDLITALEYLLAEGEAVRIINQHKASQGVGAPLCAASGSK